MSQLRNWEAEGLDQVHAAGLRRLQDAAGSSGHESWTPRREMNREQQPCSQVAHNPTGAIHRQAQKASVRREAAASRGR